MQAINDIGELYYLVSRLTLITRQFQVSRSHNYPDFDTIEDFKLLINNTLLQRSNILIDYSSWSDCKGSNAIKESIIPFVTFDNPYTVRYTNLYDLTGEIISNVKNI